MLKNRSLNVLQSTEQTFVDKTLQPPVCVSSIFHPKMKRATHTSLLRSERSLLGTKTNICRDTFLIIMIALVRSIFSTYQNKSVH